MGPISGQSNHSNVQSEASAVLSARWKVSRWSKYSSLIKSVPESACLGVQTAYQSSEEHAGRRGESIQIHQLLFPVGKSSVELFRFHRRRTVRRRMQRDEAFRSVDITVGRVELRTVHGALCTAVSIRAIRADRVSSRPIRNALFHSGRRSKCSRVSGVGERVGIFSRHCLRSCSR